MKKTIRQVLLFCFLFVNVLAFAQTPSQTLRGRVTDADSGRPLVGATILILETTPPFGTTTEENGSYFLENVPVGRYRVQVSYIGYETAQFGEVLVESGKEVVQDISLREKQEALQEVVVKTANGSPHPVSNRSLSVEQQFRFPATYYDPARLAMNFPGVAGENDGTNIISVRGNSPNALRWRLEGVDIVNPNHTANAGTFGDRPTQAGGGVNILSAQLLGNSTFLSGAFPAEYGDALGGILDMNFRRGNERRNEFTAQAGVIGIEAAAEGPFLSQHSDNQNLANNNPSYLVNYRYSFVGLLTAMGVDFGDEETSFQDLSFHLVFPQKNGGNLSVFGMGGASKTLFDSPADSALVTEDKERFDIDFHSKMGAAGAVYVLPVGKKSVWRTVAVLSALEHERVSSLVVPVEGSSLQGEQDFFSEQKIALATTFASKVNASQRFKMGVYLTRQSADFQSLVNFASLQFNLSGNLTGWLFQPFFEWHAQLSPRFALTFGIHESFFTHHASRFSFEPRLSVSYAVSTRSRLSLAYGLHSQTQLPQVYALETDEEDGLGFTRSHHLVAGWRQEIGKSLIFNMEAYYQKIFDAPLVNDFYTYSTLNLTDFSLANLTRGFSVSPLPTISGGGRGRNYGLEMTLQKFLFDRYYFLFASSLYRSEYVYQNDFEQRNLVWRPTRFDGRYLFNLTGGREFLKEKKGKVVIKGLNARLVWFGGFRTAPVDMTTSALQGFTVFVENEAFSQKMADYVRLDFRFYIKWNKPGFNSTFSLDIQNVTSRKNPGYEYYDVSQQKVMEKRQLGLIPLLSYRAEF